MAPNARQVVVASASSRRPYRSTSAHTTKVAADSPAGALQAFHPGWTSIWTARPTASAPSDTRTAARGQVRGEAVLGGSWLLGGSWVLGRSWVLGASVIGNRPDRAAERCRPRRRAR
jgi:hypothetical protein